MVNIKEKFIPKNTKARSGIAMEPQYICIHNTANTSRGADAASHASYMNNSGKNTYVSYHYVVDDKEAYHLVPCNEVAWHAGDGNNGPGNRKSIAIEICENSDGSLLKATDNAVILTAHLMKEYKIPLSNVVQHHHWSGKNCPNRIRAGEPYNWATFLKKVEAYYNTLVAPTPVPVPAPSIGLQATALKSLTNEQVIAKVGPLFTADQKKTGVLASISMAQFLLESSYGKSELAQNANNCFGMKQNLSGNTWAGSKWDGKSIYEKVTNEFNEGELIELKRPFRKYACIEDSIADHSAYLIGAKNGTALRYAGLKGETDYKVVAQIIKNGGYATSPTYVSSLCELIEKLGLTKYDAVAVTATTVLYRVRKSWDNPASQLGAFNTLDNAKAACKSGYFVFDEKGNVVYPVAEAKPDFGVGSEIKLVAGAKYINGKSIPNWILKSKLYIREVRDNGDIVFSTLKSGAITGVVSAKYVVNYTGTDAFKPYTVTINTDALNVRKGPGIIYGKTAIVTRGQVFTIVQEKNGFGQLKSGAGWISLKYTKKK